MSGNRICKEFTGAAVLSGLLLSIITGKLCPVSVYGQESYLTAEELFTDRDLLQTADLSEAQSLTVTDGEDIHVTKEGVYVLSGEAQNVTVYIEAGDEEKVQLVLDDVTIFNADFPCIYVKSADKVFLTMASDSSFSVTGEFVKDDSTNTDGVIFSPLTMELYQRMI